VALESSTALVALSPNRMWCWPPPPKPSSWVSTPEWIAAPRTPPSRRACKIKLYAIIYELIDEVKEAMAGLLEPVAKDLVVLGAAEVRKIFALS